MLLLLKEMIGPSLLNKEALAHKDRQGSKECKDLKAQQVRKDRLAHRDRLVRQGRRGQ
jgi:hypothetical protein